MLCEFVRTHFPPDLFIMNKNPGYGSNLVGSRMRCDKWRDKLFAQIEYTLSPLLVSITQSCIQKFCITAISQFV